eukprot:ANDGO_07886.mRNA.1 hypothetical protein
MSLSAVRFTDSVPLLSAANSHQSGQSANAGASASSANQYPSSAYRRLSMEPNNQSFASGSRGPSLSEHDFEPTAPVRDATPSRPTLRSSSLTFTPNSGSGYGAGAGAASSSASSGGGVSDARRVLASTTLRDIDHQLSRLGSASSGAPSSSNLSGSNPPVGAYGNMGASTGRTDIRAIQESMEAQAQALSQDLHHVRDDIRAQFDALLGSVAPTTGAGSSLYGPPSSSLSTGNIGFGGGGQNVFQSEQERMRFRTILDDHFVRLEATLSAMRDASDRERVGVAGALAAMEHRLAVLEASTLSSSSSTERVVTLVEKRFGETVDRLDRLSLSAESAERMAQNAQSNTSSILARIADVESGLRMTQDRLEQQIRWGNELEETAVNRLEESTRTTNGIKSDLMTLQRAASRFDDHIRRTTGLGGDEVAGGPNGSSAVFEVKRTVEMLESEIQVLHRRLTNAIRVFHAEPKEPLISSSMQPGVSVSGASWGNSNNNGAADEDLFLLKTLSGSGSGSRSSSIAPARQPSGSRYL